MLGMTAKVSAFARAYHSARDAGEVFDDRVAARLLTEKEYAEISHSMGGGVQFFDPGYSGDDPLDRVARLQLMPGPVSRQAFAENALAESGLKTYVALAAGLDSFACRCADVQAYEVDLPDAQADKRERLARAGIEERARFVAADLTLPGWEDEMMKMGMGKPCFVSALGLVYYLPEPGFDCLLAGMSRICAPGSLAAMDYPDEWAFTARAGARQKRQAMLAGGAGEKMQKGYASSEMEKKLNDAGFVLRAHLNPDEITRRYFAAFNARHPEKAMTAFDNTRYLLAEKV